MARQKPTLPRYSCAGVALEWALVAVVLRCSFEPGQGARLAEAEARWQWWRS